jgi:ABC-type branched-subunit amino acid transport system substrate-binding protein
MARSHRRAWRGAAVVAVVSLVSAFGAQAGGAQQNPPVDQPGVTDKEIRVGGVVTASNDVTGGNRGAAFDGVNAYFDYINDTEGGVYGRKLVLSSERDDALANNRAEVQGLISQDDVFAALPIAVLQFVGADQLAESGIPTFGWQTNEEWGSEDHPSPPNFFGQAGSFICFTCAKASIQSWLPKKLDRHKVAVLGFGGVPASEKCAEGLDKSFKKYGTAEIVFLDQNVAFGNPDYSAQVAQMKEAGVDLVIPCIDNNGAVTLAREIKKQGLDAVQVLPNSYDQKLVEENAEVLDGSYVFTVFSPFEAKPKPAGLKLYEKWIKKGDYDLSENSLVGWLNAALFVEGLKAAGPDFTQQKVVDAINSITDFTAGGILPGVDWTKAHEDENDCYAVSEIVDGTFVPRFGEKGKPFVCLPQDLKKIPLNPPVSD